MAAKKKATRKAPARPTDITGRQIVKSDFTEREWKDAQTLVSRAAIKGSTSKTLPEFQQNRVNAFMDAASPGSPTRAPGEILPGLNFYVQHSDVVTDSMRDNPSDVSRDIAFEAAGQLSTRNRPAAEKATLGQLIRGHAQGQVTFTPELLSALHEYDKEAVDTRNANKIARAEEAARKNNTPVKKVKLDTPYQAPFHLEGQTLPFAEVAGEHIAAMSSPFARNRGAQQHVTGVDLTELGKTGMHNVRAEAQDIIREQKTTDPHTNPKHFGYVDSHKAAADADAAMRAEYNLRAMHIANVKAGLVEKEQGMFDFYGLRDSNEGLLSDKEDAPTAEDSWMKGGSYQHSDVKKGGDAVVTKKSVGKNKPIGGGDPRFTPIAIEHAVHHDATVGAAQQIQNDLGLDFPVPVRMVQEVDWAHWRRQAGEDKDFNKMMKEEADNDKFEAMTPGEQTHFANAKAAGKNPFTAVNKLRKLNSKQFADPDSAPTLF